MESPPAVRAWTKSDLLGICLLLERRGDKELCDLVWQFSSRAKGGANAVVSMPDDVSRMFERIWNGEVIA